MFCLPYAGGGASAYTGLLRRLTDLIDLTVVPLQLPGRENRIAEPPAFTVAGIADEIAPATGEPYALYGHSMGARLAFEVARELRRRGLRPPSRLYVGGAHPPDRRVPLAAAVELPDDAFIDQLVRRSGALPELKHLPELRELMLPVLRSDFTWIRNYAYAPEPPLGCPVVAFGGLDDGEVGAAELLGWARHTAAGFRLRTLRGGHLFVKDSPGELAALIAADLTAGHAPPGPDELHLWLGGPDGHEAVLRRHAGRAVAGAVHAGGLTLVAATGQDAPRPPGASGEHGPGIGVALLRALGPGRGGAGAAGGRRGGGAGGGWPAELSDDEREQIEDAAEEDRPWLALHAVAAKRALLAACGEDADPAAAGFPDLADPGPWRARCGPGLERLARWQVVRLPLHTARGEVLAAVAVPPGRALLSLDMPAVPAA
ncbi:thioesterase domain-containing protein [Actinomadura sp. ATCC 31491]|uniref:Thioesterase domain-containing protein n=1 Tax=Actinomadura luzonensis TaxID=2805427 RepID=A0ABT0FXX6_9ACTN|nr:thioesterase domain-containing protein [Actinomadura luzonensis]MCK2217008.1 thioesterase domain-containing protein [Actinomadura luzonensis]